MNNIEEKVITFIAEIAEKDPLTVKKENELINDLGMDSIKFLELEYEIQQLTSQEITIEDLKHIKTVQQAIDFAQSLIHNQA